MSPHETVPAPAPKFSKTRTQLKNLCKTLKSETQDLYHELKHDTAPTRRALKNLWQRGERYLENKLHPPSPQLPQEKRWSTVIGNYDGFFVCTQCGDETTLFYQRGPYPFHHLRCMNPSCGTILSESTPSTPIIQPRHLQEPGPHAVSRIARALVACGEIPYFTVCSACGLPHRARRVLPPGLSRVQRFWCRALESRGLESRFEGCDADVTWIDFGHVYRCKDRQCRALRRERGPERWATYMVGFDRRHHFPDADFEGYYGVVPN